MLEVVLREVQDEDLDTFFEHQKDPTANQMVAFTVRDPFDHDAFLAHWAKIRSDHSVAIRTIQFEKQVAGYVAKFEHLGRAEVCYSLGKDYWGRGIATAGLSQLLVEIKERPLYAGVAGDNVASLRVLEKCGFVAVAREKNYAKARGQEVEEVILMLK